MGNHISRSALPPWCACVFNVLASQRRQGGPLGCRMWLDIAPISSWLVGINAEAGWLISRLVLYGTEKGHADLKTESASRKCCDWCPLSMAAFLKGKVWRG